MDNKIQTSKDLKKHIPQVIISISKLDENDKEFVKEVLKAFFSAGINQVSHEIKDRKSTRLNSSHNLRSRMPSSA